MADKLMRRLRKLDENIKRQMVSGRYSVAGGNRPVTLDVFSISPVMFFKTPLIYAKRIHSN
jgi:hypothetical protein